MKAHIVFDGPPSHEAGRFVEVENDAGASIALGEWVDRYDGYWALVLDVQDSDAEPASDPYRHDATCASLQPSDGDTPAGCSCWRAATATELQQAREDAASAERNEWASYFENIGATVPPPGVTAQTTFTAQEVADMLRGPKPFGVAAS